jgi:F0F1-type ATP synthase delta subunit
MSWVVRKIKDEVVDPILDIGQDIIDFAVDEVIDPVVTAVGDVVDYALDNPIEAIAIITATAMGLPPNQAAMLIGAGSGTQTLVDGGSLEDAVKDAVVAGASSFVGAKVGSYVGPTVDTAAAATFSNPRLASTVATAVTKGTESAAKTFIQTGDLGDAARAFASSAVVVGATDAIDVGVDYANEQLGISNAADEIMGNVGQELETSGVLESLGLDSINDLSDGVKDSLKAGIVAEITGQDVSSAMFNATSSEILNAIGSADFVQDYIGDEGFIRGVVDKYALVAEHMQGVADNFKTATGEYLTEPQLKVITDATSAAWDVAKRGNPELAGETFFGEDGLAKNAYEYVEDLLTDPLNLLLDRVTGNYDASVEAATALNNANIAFATAKNLLLNSVGYQTYQAHVERAGPLVEERDAALAVFEANKTQANADVVNALNQEIMNLNTGLTYYSQFVSEDHPLVRTYLEAAEVLGVPSVTNEDGTKTAATGLYKEYEDTLQYVQTDYEDLDESQIKMDADAIQAAVEAMVPTFSSQDHKSFYGLDDDTDTHKHYLETGQNGPTTKDEGEATLDAIRLSTVKSALTAKGIPFEALKPSQISMYLAYADQEIKSLANLVGLDTERFADNMIYSAELSPEVVKAAKDAGFVPETLDFSEDNTYLGANRFEDSYGMLLTGEYIRVQERKSADPNDPDSNETIFDDSVPPVFLDTRGLIDENIDQWISYNGYTLDNVTHVGDGYYNRSDIESPIERSSLVELTNAINTWTDPDLQPNVGDRVLDTVELGIDVEVEDLLNGNVTLVNDKGVLSWELTANEQEAIGENTDLTSLVNNVNAAIDVSTNPVFDPLAFKKVPDGFSYLSGDKLTAYTEDGSISIQKLPPMSNLLAGTLDGMSDEQGRLFDTNTGNKYWDAWNNVRNVYLTETPEDQQEIFSNTASVVVGASGEMLQAISGLATLAGANPNNAVGTAAKDLLAVSGDLKSEEWQTGAADMQARSQNYDVEWREENPGQEPNLATKAYLKTAAIFGNLVEHPVQFLAENVASEILQEIPIFIVSGGVGNVAKAALLRGGAAYTSKVAAKVTGVKVGSALSIDMAEAFGGTAAGSFDETYANAIAATNEDGSRKFTDEQATELALDTAQKAGTIAMFTAGVVANFGGNALARSILGDNVSDLSKDAFSTLSKKITDGAEVTIKEGTTEFIEEALPQLFTATVNSQIDPDYDVVGSVYESGLLGSISGVGVGATLYSGNALADALTLNSDVVNTINNAASAEAATTALTNLGITDTAVLNNILNSTYDTMYVSTNEAAKIFKDAQPGFVPTDAEIESFVSKRPESDVATAVAAYVDPKFLDASEAKAAALAEGITLTDEQAAAYEGQKDEAAAVAEIKTEYDPQGTTREEAVAGFQAQNGYTPTEDELAQFTGAVRDDELDELLFGYTDDRQVTEAEARKFYEDQGYTPTDEEIANFVGQGESDFQATTETNVDNYVNPRQVTSDEARKYFTDLGYNPTDEQVANFVAQVAETDQSDIISKYVNPRQVTRSELETIANEEGLTLTDALAATYVGQGEAATFSADTLAAARTEYDPLATTVEEATQFFADTGYTATPEEIADFVTSTAEAVQQSAIGEYVNPRQVTEDEAAKFLSDIGYNPTSDEVASFVGQANDATYQSTQQTAVSDYVTPRMVTADEVRAEYVRLGLADPTEEDINKFVGQFDQTTKLAEIESYLPTAQYNALVAKIDDVTGQPNTDDVQELVDASITATETRLTALIDANKEAGLTQDQATQSALDTLTQELGTTETELLDEIGTTKAALIGDITQLGEDITATETRLTALIDANETAGLTRDQATQSALDTLTQELGTTETALLAEIGTTKDALTADITQITENLGGDIDSIAEVLGKPARDVTQEDVDFVANSIALDTIFTEQEITQYDVNNDGVVDKSDEDLLIEALDTDTDTDTDIDTDTDTDTDTDIEIGPTGLYADIDTQNDLITELQKELELQNEQQLDMQQDLNTQIDTQINQTNFNQFQDMLANAGDIGGQRVDVLAGDKVNLDYLYDFESIFANPQQESLFGSPYSPRPTANPRGGRFAQGGQVEDKNDMLLRILGEM